MRGRPRTAPRSRWSSAPCRPPCRGPARRPDGAPQGLDVAVAQLVGRQLGRPFEFHWCASAAAPGIACARAAATSSSASPHDAGPPRRSPGAFPTPAASSGWWSRRRARASAPWPTCSASGSASWPGRWPRRRRTTRSSASRRARSSSTGSQPTSSTPPSSTPTSPPGTCTTTRSWSCGWSRTMCRASTGTWPWPCAAEDAQLLVEINRALAELAESGELKKVYAEHGRALSASRSRAAPARPAPVNTWKRIQRPRRAGRQHGPRQPALFQREGRPPGLRRGAGAGAGPRTRPQAAHRLAGRPARDRHRASCSRASATSPSARPSTPNAVDDDEAAGGQGDLLAALLRHRLRARHAQERARSRSRWRSSRASKSRRLGTEAGSVADYRLRQRGYLRSLFRNQLAVLKALRRRRHRLRLPLGQRRLDAARHARLQAGARAGLRAGGPLEHRRRHASRATTS